MPSNPASIPPIRPHLVVKTWRDRWNPDAGGAEVWLDQVLTRLVTRWDITVLTQVDPGRPDDEVLDGIRYQRRGGVMSQYGRAHVSQASLSRSPDIVLDVFNGVPFLSALNHRNPVVVVVHHVHREQWRMMFGPVIGRTGWLLERAAARAQRHRRHITVSQPSADAITTTYRVHPELISLAHNGFTPAPDHLPDPGLVPATHRVVSLGRLVPHKRVEVAITATHAARAAGCDVHLDVVGDGEWRSDLETVVARLAMHQHVTFHGHVDHVRKHAILAAADVLALPSVREGWGIVVMEAGQHGVPTIAMAHAGGTTESVVHGVGGLLADDDDEFVTHLRALLDDPAWRARLGAGAAQLATRFTWDATATSVDATLRAAMADHRHDTTRVEAQA